MWIEVASTESIPSALHAGLGRAPVYSAREHAWFSADESRVYRHVGLGAPPVLPPLVSFARAAQLVPRVGVAAVTSSSEAGPRDYTIPVVLAASAVGIGLITLGYYSGKSKKRR